MLARIWRGATCADDADEYVKYLEATGLREYRVTPGHRGVLPLRRVVNGSAEFVLLTFWDSENAIRAFAGDDISRAVFYPEDDRFLVDRGVRVEHFDVRLEERR